jgi:hypothetical protein
VKRKILTGCAVMSLGILMCACGHTSDEPESVTQTTQAQETVIGNSGQRYVMDTQDALNTEQAEDNYDKYSELQEVLRDIIKETNQ